MAGMLSAVPTHLLNIAGNTVQGGVTLALKEGQVGADLARVGIGRHVLGKDVARQRFQAEVGPQVAGYGRGLWAGVQQIPAILKGDLPQDFVKHYDARGLQSGSRVLDTAVEFPLRALAASDAVFRSAAFGGHAAALATRQATQEGLSGAARSRRVQEILGNVSDYPVLLENANHLAARDVFQESRGLTDAIAKAKREHASAQVAGDIILPFYRTPYNVAAQGAGMTLPGYASAIAAAKRGETGEAIDRAVRATVGTVAMGVGYQLASNNLLTGAYPSDASDRSTLPEGWKPYSLRVPSGDGAVYVPIQSLGALAVPLGAAAVVVDAQKRGVDKNDLAKGVYAGLGGIGQFLGDMSALQGLNSVFKLVTEPERSVERTAEGLASSFVPVSGLARQVQQALGDAARDPGNPLEAFMAGVPGLSRLVPEKLTPMGSARERGPSGWKALVTGGRVGVERDEPVVAAFRGAGASLSAPGTSVIGHEITPAEQRRVQTRAGELLRERVTAWQTDPEFRALDADERKKILDRALQRAHEDAGLAVLDPLGDDELAQRRATHAARR
jgi:putative NIF3 family GTP cyclohydrolase 1 type 2